MVERIKINVENVSRTVHVRGDDSNRTRTIAILDGVSFKVPASTSYAIIGPSGSGKSTLLRMLNRLEEPSTGTVFLDNTDIRSLDVIALRRRIGFVAQTPVVFAGTMKDNVLLPLHLHKLPLDDAEEAINRLLKLTGLPADLLPRTAEYLSVGEKQRVAIIRALMLDPQVLLLDEPTANLDPFAAREFLEHVKKVQERLGLTIVIVTHQMRHAKYIGDNVLVLAEGRAVEQGTVDDLFTHPSKQLTRKLLSQDTTMEE